MRCKLNTQRLNEEYTILWFEFDLCGLRHRQDRDERHMDPEFEQEFDMLQGKYEIMNLLKGKVISRHKVTPIVTTQQVLDIVVAILSIEMVLNPQ